MKKFLALLLLALFVVPGCSSDNAEEKTDDSAAQAEQSVESTQTAAAPAVEAPAPPVESKNILNALAQTGNHSTLIAAIEAAGLSDGLANGGPYTLFAPTDDAFKHLNPEALNNLMRPESKDQLARILTLHVVNGKVTAADLRAQPQQELVTLNGQSVPVVVDVNGSLSYGSANIISPDIPASNGLIQSIDAVVLPAAD